MELEETGQARPQAFCDLFDIHQRDISHATLNPAVIGSMQSTALSSLLLVNSLCFTNTANCAAKADADVERRHYPQSSWLAVNA
jgi:hypothetical protein